MSRLGFGPRTRGSKVSLSVVHGVLWLRFLSMPRAVLVHEVHAVRPTLTAVAVNVAVRSCEPSPQHQQRVEIHAAARGPGVLGTREDYGQAVFAGGQRAGPDDGRDFQLLGIEIERGQLVAVDAEGRRAPAPRRPPSAFAVAVSMAVKRPAGSSRLPP